MSTTTVSRDKAGDLTLSTRLTTRVIEAGMGFVDIRLPLTRDGWDAFQLFVPGEPVGLVSADSDTFATVVAEADEDTYVITLEVQ